MAERGALLKAQFLSTAPRKRDVHRTSLFRFVVDSCAKVQVSAGSREKRITKKPMKEKMCFKALTFFILQGIMELTIFASESKIRQNKQVR